MNLKNNSCSIQSWNTATANEYSEVWVSSSQLKSSEYANVENEFTKPHVILFALYTKKKKFERKIKTTVWTTIGYV